MAIWQIIPIFYLLAAAGALVFIALKPKFFWIFMVGASVGSAGLVLIPKSPYCVALVDELLVASIAGGALLALSTGAVRIVKKPATLLAKIHQALFFALAGYMFLQSIRGLFLWHDILLARWVCFYFLIALASFLVNNTDLPVPKKPILIRTVLLSWFFYLVAYLLHGFFVIYFLKISYFSLNIQGVQWTGPNYALLPMLAAVPAALMYLRRGFGTSQWLGWAGLILTLVAGYVYESRAVFIALAVFMVFSPAILGFKKVIPIVLAGTGAVAFFYWRTLYVFAVHMISSVTFSYEGDEGRYAIIRAAIDAICQRVDTFLFGYGINSHHYVLPPFMRDAGHPTIGQAPDYSQIILPGQDFTYAPIGGLPEYVRVTGFGSLLTDIGFIGAFLLAAVALVLALRLLTLARARARFAALAALGLVLGWMVFSKVEDVVLVWFMLMPSGILLALARDSEDGSV